MWFAVGVTALCRVAEAEAAASDGHSAVANELGGHPVLSVLVHIIFLSVLLGAGSSIVAVLFKSPFRE